MKDTGVEDNRKTAESVYSLYRTRIKELTDKATAGDKDAAVMVLHELANQEHVLRLLGYMTSDYGNLVKWKKPNKKEQELNDLTLKAAKGDADAAIKLMQLMCGQPQS